MFISATPSAFIINVCMVPTNKLRNIMKYMSFVDNFSVPSSVKKLTAHCTCKEIKKSFFQHKMFFTEKPSLLFIKIYHLGHNFIDLNFAEIYLAINRYQTLCLIMNVELKLFAIVRNGL